MAAEKKCKKHNIPLLSMPTGKECVVCLRVNGIKQQARQAKSQDKAKIKKKEQELAELKKSVKEGVSRIMTTAQYYEAHAQEIFDLEKKIQSEQPLVQ